MSAILCKMVVSQVSMVPFRSIAPVLCSSVKAALTLGRLAPISRPTSPCDMPSASGIFDPWAARDSRRSADSRSRASLTSMRCRDNEMAAVKKVDTVTLKDLAASLAETHSRPETVKGLRLRGGDPLFDLMLSKAGAIPVEMTSNEIYKGMQSGQLDGALTSYETFVSAKIYEHAKYFTAGSPGIWMFATPLLISKTVWDSLSEAEKVAFEAAAETSEVYFAATQNDAEKRFIETFTRAGAQFHRFTHQDYLAWLRLAQQTAWKEYLALSPKTESMLLEVVESMLDRARSK